MIVLFFCVRDIQQIKIPDFKEHICSFSFQYCQQFEMIEIPNDSRLQMIDKYAFSWSRIKSIRNPTSVTSIGRGTCYHCSRLEVIEIPYDSKLEIIDK